jgi:lipopolysaccharide export system permease protein
MKTLQRYIGRDVLFATLLIFGALLALFAFFDLIHELGDVGRGDYTISRALLYVTLHLPSRLYELFPVAALIGTLFAIAQLVANSEYTVMRASGMSLARVTWSVLRVGLPLAAATFLAGEYVAPPAERIAQTVRTSSDSSRVVAQQFESGFWFKQDLTFVNIRTVLADMTLSGVRMYEFGDDLRLKVVRIAQSGRFAGNGQWELENVKSTEIGTDATRDLEKSCPIATRQRDSQSGCSQRFGDRRADPRRSAGHESNLVPPAGQRGWLLLGTPRGTHRATGCALGFAGGGRAAGVRGLRFHVID